MANSNGSKVIQIIGILLAASGGVWVVSTIHQHDEYVERNEMEMLQNLMTSEHAAIRREIQSLNR